MVYDCFNHITKPIQAPTLKNISHWGKSSSAPDMMVELSDSAGRVHVTARGRLGWSTNHCFLGHLLGVHVIAGWCFQICFCMFNTVEAYFGRIWDADLNEIYLRGVKSTNINQPDLVGFFSGMEEGSWFWREVRRKPGIQRPCPLGGRRPGCPIVTLWECLQFAIDNGPAIVDLPIKNGDFP